MKRVGIGALALVLFVQCVQHIEASAQKCSDCKGFELCNPKSQTCLQCYDLCHSKWTSSKECEKKCSEWIKWRKTSSSPPRAADSAIGKAQRIFWILVSIFVPATVFCAVVIRLCTCFITFIMINEA